MEALLPLSYDGDGAGWKVRTPGLIITSDALYHLS